MSDSAHKSQTAPAETATTTTTPPQTPNTGPQTLLARRIPHTRTSATWFGICITALLSVVLIVFMLQNTRSVEVSFLGMNGSLPLALALLIAAVGAAIVTMFVGAARIAQLRRLSRPRR